jgi:hypothetical protein
MQSRRVTFVIWGLLASAAALSTALALRSFDIRRGARPASGVAPLHAYGSRGAARSGAASAAKMDAVLADLSRHAALARPAHALADLHAMSPAARFMQTGANDTPRILVDAVTRGDPRQLKSALVALGMRHAVVFANDVGGWLPVNQLDAAAARGELVGIRAAMPRTRAGAVTSQGDYAQRSAALRAAHPALTGAGVTVGVLSDSFNCYAVYAEPNSGVPASGTEGYASNGFTADFQTDASSGDLPASVNVLEEADCLSYGQPVQLPFSDEGRAMLQIVHDVAPEASLAFYTADDSEADFANGITTLAANGVKVIADDVGYYDEPFYQDGLLAEAVDAVAADGAAYFSAAGNNGDASYENTAPSFTTLSSGGSMAGEYLLNFDQSGGSTVTSLPLTIGALVPGDFIAVVVEWDQPYVTGAAGSPGASSQIDVCVTGATSDYLIEDYDGNTVTCTGPNATGVDPVQILIIGNPADASGNTAQENLSVVIGLVNPAKAPGRILVAVETDGQTSPSPIGNYATNSATLQGHPGAAGAAAVGAAFYFQTPACGTSSAVIEPYSAQGGAPILFDTSGNRLATPVIRQKPDFVGPDGVNDTFLGFTLASSDINGIQIGANGLLPSTVTECQNVPSYPNFFGTSAATPHAAGIAALMLQSNAAATPTQIYTALQGTALPMTATTPNFNTGYGFIQADAAYAALLAAGSSSGGSSSSSGSGSSSGGTSSSSGSSSSGGTSSSSGSSSSSSGAAPSPSGGGGGAIDGLMLALLAGLSVLRPLRTRRPS